MAATQEAVEQDVPSTNGWFQLAIPHDGSNVTIKKIVSHTGAGKPVQSIDIIKKLKAEKVCHGVNSKAIEELLTELANNQIPEEPVIIANSDVVAGTDGSLDWRIENFSDAESIILVATDEIIAELTAADKGNPGKNVFGKLKQPRSVFEPQLKAGPGIRVEVSEHGVQQFTSDYAGELKYADDIVSIDPHISISDDKMQVQMDIPLASTQNLKRRISEADVLVILEQLNISHGILTDNIQSALANNQDKSGFIDSVEVALGKPARDGVEARLLVDEQLAVGKLQENGEIDFHEKSYPWNINSGDIIGRLIPPQREEDGYDVMGEVLSGVVAKNTILNLEGIRQEADGTLFASMDGVLLVNGSNISVSDRLVVRGDVCLRTGNIHSDQTVIVKGYVEPGYIIESRGDVIVEDNVEQALVRATGSIVIKSGIRGSETRIISRQNITASFIENATLRSMGNITAENSMVSCDTYCKGLIIIGNQSKKGTLIGGETRAIEGLIAANLGSEGCKKTVINVGVSDSILEELKKVNEEISKTEQGLNKVENALAQRRQNPAPGNEELLEKIGRAIEEYQGKLEKLQLEHGELQSKIKLSRKATVVVKEHVYPGVRINILDKYFEVTKKENAGVFFLEEDLIIFRPAG